MEEMKVDVQASTCSGLIKAAASTEAKRRKTPRESTRRNGSTPRGPTAQWNVVQPSKEVGRTWEQHG